MVPASLLKFLDDAVALGGRSVDGHQIVIVKIHAPGSCFGQQGHNVRWRHRRPHKIAEGIAPSIAHGPKSKGEFVFGAWQ